jgi:hypothetical protein
METKEFNEIVKKQSESEIATLTAKADEYARGDRLGNFKEIGSMLGCTPERALIGLVAKHWIALKDFIADLDKGVVQSDARWDEKIGDIRAYMTLLRGLVTERINAKPTHEIHVDPAWTVQSTDAITLAVMAGEIAKPRYWVAGFASVYSPESERSLRLSFATVFTKYRDYAVKKHLFVWFCSYDPDKPSAISEISCCIEPTGTYTLNDNCPSWVRRVAEKAETIGIDVTA